MQFTQEHLKQIYEAQKEEEELAKQVSMAPNVPAGVSASSSGTTAVPKVTIKVEELPSHQPAWADMD